MMPAAYGNKSRATHAAVVDLVAGYLDSKGIAATAHHRPAKLSDAVGDIQPDVSAEGIALNVTSRLQHRLSIDLDAATDTARLSESPVGAFVQWRGDRPVDQSYVVMSLGTLAALIRIARPS